MCPPPDPTSRVPSAVATGPSGTGHPANSAGLVVTLAEFRLLTDAEHLARADPPGGVGQADAMSGETSPEARPVHLDFKAFLRPEALTIWC
jgi:hypothetical protein